MKTGSLLAVVVLAATFFSVGIFSGDAQAAVSAYLGDICWHYRMNDGDIGALDVGLQDMGGGGHFLVSGTFTSYGNPPIDSIINGNAEAFTNGIYMTLTRSRLSGSNGMVSSIIHVTLDIASFNGTIDETATAADTVSPGNPLFNFRQGNIYIGCP
jgi:hypothetical protein